MRWLLLFFLSLLSLHGKGLLLVSASQRGFILGEPAQHILKEFAQVSDFQHVGQNGLKSISSHLEDPEVLEKISSQRWDTIVICGNRFTMTEKDGYVFPQLYNSLNISFTPRKAAKQFTEFIRHGTEVNGIVNPHPSPETKILWMMNWADVKRGLINERKHLNAKQNIQQQWENSKGEGGIKTLIQDNDGTGVYPIGYAWWLAMDYDLKHYYERLYKGNDGDGFHALGPDIGYMGAWLFYAILTGQKIPLEYETWRPEGISEKDARVYREIAQKAYEDLYIKGEMDLPADPVSETPPPQVEQLDDDRLRIGMVECNKKTGEVRFPAEVNYITGKIVEAIVVHKKGRSHESVFITDASPININIAFKLLGAEPSEELFQILDDQLRPTGKYPMVSAEVKEKARMQITVEWEDESGRKSSSLEEWIGHQDKDTQMDPSAWLYTGSYFRNGKFRAEATGDIISIYAARSSLMNFPGKGRSNDEIWYVHRSKSHLAKTPVEIVISVPKN